MTVCTMYVTVGTVGECTKGKSSGLLRPLVINWCLPLLPLRLCWQSPYSATNYCCFSAFWTPPHPPTKAYVINEWSLCNHVINWCLPLPPLRLCWQSPYSTTNYCCFSVFWTPSPPTKAYVIYEWSLDNQLVPTSSSPEAVLTESILCDKLLPFSIFDTPFFVTPPPTPL